MKRSLFYVVVAAVQSLGSLGGPLLAARHLGPAQLGILAIGMLVIVLVRAAASLGLYGPISVALHDGDSGIRKGRRLLQWSGWACLPASLVLALLGLFLPGAVGSYTSAAAAGVAGAVAMGHQALHRSVTNHAAYAASLLGPTAYANAAGLLALLFIGGGARSYLAAMALASLLNSVYLHLRHVRTAERPDWPELRDALRIGLPLVVTAAATVGLSLGDRPVIGAFLGEAAVGRYHLTYIIAGGGVPLLAALNNAWLPMVLDSPPERRLQVLGHSLRGVIAGTAVMSLGALLAAPALVRLVGGAEYVDSRTPWLAAVVALGVVPFALYSGMSIGLLSQNATRPIASATVMAVVANLAANLVLIPTIGLVGGGLASVLSYTVAGVVCWRWFGWHREVDWVTPKVILSLVAFLVAVPIAAAIPIDTSWSLAVRIGLGGLVGGLGCLAVARSLSRRVPSGRASASA